MTLANGERLLRKVMITSAITGAGPTPDEARKILGLKGNDKVKLPAHRAGLPG